MIITAIHALVFCPIQQTQEVSAHCAPGVVFPQRPVETSVTQMCGLPSWSPQLHREHRGPSDRCQGGMRRASWRKGHLSYNRRDEETLANTREERGVLGQRAWAEFGVAAV